MRHPQLAEGDRCGVHARLPLDGADPGIRVEKVKRGVPLGVQHLLVAEHVRGRPILLHVEVPYRSNADLLGCIFLLLGRPQEDLGALLLLVSDPLRDLLLGTVDSLVEQIAELHGVPGPRLELLPVVALHDAKSHVVDSGHRRPVPPSLLGRVKDHVEVLLLAQVRDVHDPVSPHQEEAVIDGGQVGGIIPKAPVRLDGHQRDL
mmetsp:Transcript_8099/g.24616  ORF Transcript_8099/g.24616 Transcript_8099/m.24616 type:complete len:204 (+) Transcript_8099:323-934(+)